MKYPKIGNLYTIKLEKPSTPGRVFLAKNRGVKLVPKMPLWEPEAFGFGAQAIDEWSDIYRFPLLLIGFVQQASFSTINEHLAEFLFEEKTYWTDWFLPETFFEYFDLCSTEK